MTGPEGCDQGYKFPLEAVASSIAQGSILAPIFFIIFINDLHDGME